MFRHKAWPYPGRTLKPHIMKLTRILGISAVCAGLLMTACSKDKTPNARNGSQASFYLTDEPGDFDAVFVDVQSIEVKTDLGFQTVAVNKGVYNLLDFTDGNDTLLADAFIEGDSIKEVRLILGVNNSVVVDGVTYELQTPSAQQSGLKVKYNQALESTTDYNLVLDFDAGKSVVLTGNGKYILKPVIRIFAKEDVSSSISGVVMPDSLISRVEAIRNQTDTFGTYTTVLTGEYKISGLSEGTYEVRAMNNGNVVSKSNIMLSAGTDIVLDTLFIQ